MASSSMRGSASRSMTSLPCASARAGLGLHFYVHRQPPQNLYRCSSPTPPVWEESIFCPLFTPGLIGPIPDRWCPGASTVLSCWMLVSFLRVRLEASTSVRVHRPPRLPPRRRLRTWGSFAGHPAVEASHWEAPNGHTCFAQALPRIHIRSPISVHAPDEKRLWGTMAHRQLAPV